MSIWLKVFYILTWIPAIALNIAFIVLGLITVPIALACKEWPYALWVWGNMEDDPRTMQWWIDKTSKSKNPIQRWFPNFWWYAVRNPVNNFRFLLKDRECNYSGNWVEQDMHANEIVEAGLSVGKRWCYSGWLACYEYVKINDDNTSNEFWFGWKLNHTTPGLGFATQIKWHQAISGIHGGEIS